MKTLLVTIDSLRRDHIGFHGYDRDTTPFLDSLAEEHTVFRNAYSASCHTREAIPPILTGRYPERSTDKYQTSAETVAEALDVKSHAELTGCYITEFERYHRGFDSFNSDYLHGKRFITRQPEYVFRVLANRQYRTAKDVRKEMEARIDEIDFGWMHLMDTHHPYNKFDEFRFGEKVSRRRIQKTFRKALYTPSRVTESERQLLIDSYDNSLRYLDGQLEKLFQELPEETEAYIVGDHGELFGEYGKYEHPRMLKDELLEVPLIVRNGEKRDIDRKVSTVDIAPSIASRAGKEMESDGKDLFESGKREIHASCKSSGDRIKQIL